MLQSLNVTFEPKSRDWEKNESFFDKIREQYIEFGCMEELAKFDAMNNYIRWKGKVESANYAGRSMLRKFFYHLDRSLQNNMDNGT